MATSKKKVAKKKATKKKTSKKKLIKKATVKDVAVDLDYIVETKDEDFPQIKYKYGCPTKYKEVFCEYAIHYLAKGLSKEAMAGKLMISKTTLYEWMKLYTNFTNAISIGESLSRIWWENKTVKHVVHTKDGKQINGQVYGLNMKNRFNWQDKKEIAIEEETKKSFAFQLDNKPEGR